MGDQKPQIEDPWFFFRHPVNTSAKVKSEPKHEIRAVDIVKKNHNTRKVALKAKLVDELF